MDSRSIADPHLIVAPCWAAAFDINLTGLDSLARLYVLAFGRDSVYGSFALAAYVRVKLPGIERRVAVELTRKCRAHPRLHQHGERWDRKDRAVQGVHPKLMPTRQQRRAIQRASPPPHGSLRSAQVTFPKHLQSRR